MVDALPILNPVIQTYFAYFSELAPFLKQTVILGIIGYITFYSRTLFQTIYAFAYQRLFVSLTVETPDELYYWLHTWMIMHIQKENAKRRKIEEPADGSHTVNKGGIDSNLYTYRVCTQRAADRDSERNHRVYYGDGRKADAEDDRWNVLWLPGTGAHRFKYRGGYVWGYDSQDSDNGRPVPVNNSSSALKRRLIFTVFSWNVRALKAIVDEAVGSSQKNVQGKVVLYRPAPWNPFFVVEKEFEPAMFCNLDLPILPGDVVQNLCKDIQRFLESEMFYQRMGVPYRRGYLFHGVPGAGKTTLVKRLAAQFNLGVCIISLTDGGHEKNDSWLGKMFASAPKHSLLLIEDVDAAFPNPEDEKKKKEEAKKRKDLGLPDELDENANTSRKMSSPFTLSGLFNAIDGIGAQTGCMLVMTTNYPERLDPALTRSGRVDVKVAFDYVGEREVQLAFHRFFPHLAPDDAIIRDFASKACSENRKPRLSMADIQGHLLKWRDSPEDALQHLKVVGGVGDIQIGEIKNSSQVEGTVDEKKSVDEKRNDASVDNSQLSSAVTISDLKDEKVPASNVASSASSSSSSSAATTSSSSSNSSSSTPSSAATTAATTVAATTTQESGSQTNALDLFPLRPVKLMRSTSDTWEL